MQRHFSIVIVLICLFALTGFVQAGAPVCSFDTNPVPVELLTGEHAHFFDTSTESPDTWNWTIDDDGGPVYYTTVNVTHTYNFVGVYDVSLFVQNQAGNDTCTEEQFVTVSEPEPTTAPTTAVPTQGSDLNASIAPILGDVAGLFPDIVSLLVGAVPVVILLALVGGVVALFGSILDKIRM